MRPTRHVPKIRFALVDEGSCWCSVGVTRLQTTFSCRRRSRRRRRRRLLQDPHLVNMGWLLPVTTGSLPKTHISKSSTCRRQHSNISTPREGKHSEANKWKCSAEQMTLVQFENKRLYLQTTNIGQTATSTAVATMWTKPYLILHTLLGFLCLQH